MSSNDRSARRPEAPPLVCLEGPHSRESWFAEGGYRQKLHDAIHGYRVLGIFNGHYHASGIYRWRGRDAYLVGSAKHSWHSFAVVHVTDTRWWGRSRRSVEDDRL